MPVRTDEAADTATTPDDLETPVSMSLMRSDPSMKKNIKPLLSAAADALSFPSHRRFAQQRIGREGADGNQRHQPQTERDCGLLGEPAKDGTPPEPIGTHQQKDAQEQKGSAKEDVLPRAAKALVDAAEQQSQQV